MPTAQQLMTVQTDFDHVLAEHRGQHRCMDGVYFGPTEWGSCPLNQLKATVDRVLLTYRAEVHDAAHQPETMRTVAEAMVATPLADLPAEAQEAWTALARLATEALAHHLDPLP